MRNKDLGLVIFLVVLLILLIFIWGLLFLVMQDDSEVLDEGDVLEERYGDLNDVDLDLGDSSFEFVEYNRTRGSGGGGGGKSDKCDESQVILRLFGPENTHAALWNQTIYEEKVCYNEIFGEMYDGDDEHICTGSNKVLGLIKEFNSHVEAPGINSEEYSIDVCYGDLSCVVREDACSGTEREIVALADYRNAHLESRDTDNYNILVCCSSSN